MLLFALNLCLPVGCVGDGKDMRRHFVSLLSLVELNDLLGINRESYIGIDHNAE